MRVQPDFVEFGAMLSNLAERWRRYAGATISDAISPHDDMFDATRAGALEHYGRVGSDAMRIICSALTLARKTDVQTILDLPSGGGRVTRHLVAFFPESEIYVSDLARQKAEFCRTAFGCKVLEPSGDFSTFATENRFDLIFCGSLLTHLREESFRAALGFLSRSLADGGIAIVTLHGRSTIQIQHHEYKFIPAERFDPIEKDFLRSGFGYADYPGAKDYGISLSSPAWLCRAVEEYSEMRLLGFSERCWDNHQDVAILEKRSILS